MFSIDTWFWEELEYQFWKQMWQLLWFWHRVSPDSCNSSVDLILELGQEGLDLENFCSAWALSMPTMELSRASFSFIAAFNYIPQGGDGIRLTFFKRSYSKFKERQCPI